MTTPDLTISPLGIHWALYWILGLTAAGVLALWVSGQEPVETTDRIFYTLDMLLPIIGLDKAHDKIALSGSVKICLYVLKIMGFVLASFLVAGLSGLTKK